MLIKLLYAFVFHVDLVAKLLVFSKLFLIDYFGSFLSAGFLIGHLFNFGILALAKYFAHFILLFKISHDIGAIDVAFDFVLFAFL